jgi:hypothetical protein
MERPKNIKSGLKGPEKLRSVFGQKSAQYIVFRSTCRGRLSVASCDRSGQTSRNFGEPCLRPKSALDAAIEVHLEFDDSVECNTGNRHWAFRHCNHSARCTQTRQLLHLLGPPGKGIKVCDGIPEQELVSDCSLISNYII